jgi:hypothetical protein
MKKWTEEMSKRQLIALIEGRDAMIDHLRDELRVARGALQNCARRAEMR